MMKALVLGCGSIGTRHLHNLRALAVPALAVVEPDATRRARAAAEAGAAAFADLDAGLAWRPDLAVVATPTAGHAAAALRAARAGCHLFVEKPLSHTPEGLAELAAEAEARGLVTLVGCNMRFHPGPARVKALIDGGAVGRVLAARLQAGSYLPRWRPGQDYRAGYSAATDQGGAILDCIHEIDLALWYSGPARLAACLRRPAASLGLETDGLAELLLEHDSGVVSSVHLNFVQRDYRRGCQVIGTEGTLYWDFAERRVDLYGPDGARGRSFAEPPGWQLNQMYLDEMDHFLDRVRQRRPTVNSIAGGAAALAIALAARGGDR
jgi:predicted dehydrogenase